MDKHALQQQAESSFMVDRPPDAKPAALLAAWPRMLCWMLSQRTMASWDNRISLELNGKKDGGKSSLPIRAAQKPLTGFLNRVFGSLLFAVQKPSTWLFFFGKMVF